jgi:hypothetical protein
MSWGPLIFLFLSLWSFSPPPTKQNKKYKKESPPFIVLNLLLPAEPVTEKITQIIEVV